MRMSLVLLMFDYKLKGSSVITVHPVGNMNVWTTFHGEPTLYISIYFFVLLSGSTGIDTPRARWWSMSNHIRTLAVLVSLTSIFSSFLVHLFGSYQLVDCREILYKHSCSPQDEFYWHCWSPDFSSSATISFTSDVLSEISWLRDLWLNVVNIFMFPSGWTALTLVILWFYLERHHQVNIWVYPVLSFLQN